ncbi:MAG: hypothetical protein JST22_16975 [Bacteroidetes bacterium]|nr:hypothetical protein [Bacteroidota bacterium]
MQQVPRSFRRSARRICGSLTIALAALFVLATSATAQLNGTYTVGTAGSSYPSIDAAVTALNAGVSGPVTFLIASGTYTPPTNGWRLALVPGLSATNTVTFRPDVGATVVLSGNTGVLTQTGVFTIDGGKYYIIDGSNVSGGTSKNMTIISTEVNYNPSVFFKNNADLNTVRNCILYTYATSANSTYGYGAIFFGPTNTTSGNDSNVIRNCTIGDPSGSYRVYASVGMYGSNTVYPNIGNKVVGCDILNFRYYGIYCDNYNVGPIFQKNLIHMTSPSPVSSVYGIYLNETAGQAANATIDSNKFYKLMGTSTSSQSVFGIYSNTSSLPSGTTQITNNMMSFFEDGYIYYYGLYINSNYSTSGGSTLTYNVRYNSIYLGGTATQFAQAMPFYRYAYNSAGVGVANSVNNQNNIYYCARVGGSSTSYGLYVYASPVGGWTSNNNLIQLNSDANYYTAYYNFSLYLTLASYQTSGVDAQSVGANPWFVDPSIADLHIQTTKRTPVESRGTPIAGLTTDFDGQTRSATTPDIGADEGTFLPTIAIDAGADRYQTPVANATVKSNTLFSPIGYFSNISSTTQTVPVRTRILNSSNTVVYNDLQTFSVPANTQQRVTFNQTGNVLGSTSLAAGTYTVELGTELVSDGDATNNKITYTIFVKDPMNGAYTINKLGSGARNYVSFTSAVKDLNILGVTGAVTFKVATGVYDSTTETYPLVVGAITGVSAVNTVTFKADSLAQATLTYATGTPLVDLVSATYVTFDGANSAPNNPRGIKVMNTGNGPVFRMQEGAQFNTLKNMYLLANNTTLASGVVIFGARSSAVVGNSDNVVQGNTIGDSTGNLRSACNIYMNGDFTYRNSRNRIEDNDIINWGTTTNSGGYAIYWNNYVDFVKVFRNRIRQTTTNNTTSFGASYGIYIVNTYNNSDTIAYNKIWNLGTSNLTTTQLGIWCNSMGQSFPTVIHSNMITLTGDQGTMYGIYNTCASPTVFYIDHNSISIRGNNTTGSNYLSCGFRMTSTANINFRNNIVTNERAWISTNSSYAIYRSTSGTLTSNYNDLYVSGTAGVIGYNGTTNFTTLPSWQVVSDANSIGTKPPFVDQTTGDLHIQVQPVFGGEGQGTPLGYVKDFDLDTRDPLAPDMGADDGNFNGNGLVMLAPNGNEVYLSGETTSMQFSANRIMSARLDFSTDGVAWTPLATVNSTVKGVNSAPVTIPDVVALNARMRVISTKNQYEFDTTDAPFRVIRKLKILKPATSLLFAGDTNYIIWEKRAGEPQLDALDVDYSTDGGATWTTIVQRVPQYLDSLRWIVPNTPTNNGMLRVKNTATSRSWDTTDAIFKIVNPTIAVTTPNGGERYDELSPVTVTWVSQNVSRLKADLSTDGGASWTTVGSNIAGSASTYTFTPTPIPTQQALIRLSDMDRPRVNDQSDRYWQIGQSRTVITVYTPSQGDEFPRQSSTSITWDAPNASFVNILYSSNGGNTWTTVASNVAAGEGSRVWTVPNQNTTQGIIRIQDVNSSAQGESGTFSIVDPLVPTIHVNAPNGGEKFMTGDSVAITWTSSDVKNVNVLFSDNGGATWQTVQNNVPASQGKVTWIAPNKVGSNYLARVVSLSPSASDASDAPFEIQRRPQPSITVLAPNGGEGLTVDSMTNIQWTSQDISGQVLIEWSPDHGKTWVTISNAAASPYAWQVPNTPTTEGLVRVSALGVSDVSDGVFEISRKVVDQLQVLTPNGGEKWQMGTKHDITWRTVSSVAKIDIDYSADGGSTWIPVAAGVQMSPSLYEWTVPTLSTESNSVLVRIRNTDNPAQSDISDGTFGVLKTVAGTDDAVAGMGGLKVLGNYPNPFNGTTELRWTQGKSGDAQIRLYGVNGELVRSYDAGQRDAGEQQMVINASGLESGMYLYEVRVAQMLARGVMTVAK